MNLKSFGQTLMISELFNEKREKIDHRKISRHKIFSVFL